MKKKPAVKKILSPGEPAAVTVVNPKGKGGGVIVCDHSSRRVPRSLKNLGLPAAELKRHIGWDIGIDALGRYMARTLDMPAVFAGYSRLVIDLNRGDDHPEQIVKTSDGTVVPGNARLSAREKRQRRREFYLPYHRAVARTVRAGRAGGRVPVFLALHSFTPTMGGKKRPWHIAILWSGQKKIAKTVIANLRAQNPRLIVGDNQPYTMKDKRRTGFTAYHQAEAKGVPYVLVEFRQDLINTPTKARRWADLFIRALAPVLADPAAFRD